MLANLMFHYSCGHIAHNFVSGDISSTEQEKICPKCSSGGISTVAFNCELCGAPAETTASGFKCSQRLLCANCRKIYNRWDCMARKAKKARRSFPDLHHYIKGKPDRALNDAELRNSEPPLSPVEFKEIACFGSRVSPCAKCEYITNDKNETPCSQCVKLNASTQNPDKLFLDSLYL